MPPVAEQHKEEAFRLLVEEHRAELHAHCYRMLGALHDAEDALQETLLRAWRALPGFEGRSAMRTWLYRIATNACMDAIARRPKRVLPIDHGPPSAPTHDFGRPLVETVWIEPYPDGSLAEGHAGPEARYEQREAVELAFIASLQHLSAPQRAVLILRDVLGFSAQEVSETLETTVASVNSALQRARKAVEQRLPERTQQQTLRSLGDDRMRELVETYMEAWARADVETLRRLLAEDAILSMPPWAIWWRGREALIELGAAAGDACPETRAVLTSANGQPAVASYGLDPETRRYTASAIDVLTIEGSQIGAITAFVSPELFAAFGLPPELA
jgi:RNA polymerase sigma-70 factor, ECF subfamily